MGVSTFVNTLQMKSCVNNDSLEKYAGILAVMKFKTWQE
jgi:hypothetical protein